MEPLTLAALGGVALTEGVKFLYQQASELIRYWRDRRDADPDTPVAEPAVEPPAGLLAGQLAPPAVDHDALRQLAPQLRDLRRELIDYVEGYEPIAPQDERLLRNADALRRLLEAVYQQRITFQGEQRDATGPLLTGRVDVDQVAGYAAAVRIESVKLARGEVRGELRAQRIEEGGEGVGLDIGTIDG